MQAVPFITIVSGLPRSGTSLMMQMLAAGGMTVLTDNLRQPDQDNPRGYFEYEPVKRTAQDASWLDGAIGKAVKVVHLLLYDLPTDRQYRVIFMNRRLEEVIASQRKMLERSGRQGAQTDDATLIRTFDAQVRKVLQWLSQQPNFSTHQVWYHELISEPLKHAAMVNEFLGKGLNEAAMALAVEPTLYRNRIK